MSRNGLSLNNAPLFLILLLLAVYSTAVVGIQMRAGPSMPLGSGLRGMQDRKTTASNTKVPPPIISEVTARGFLCEEHFVKTHDGYILRLFRVQRPDQTNEFSQMLPIVVLLHDFADSAASFVLDERSPAYVFANLGFDVWLPNMRGNIYSKNHTMLRTDKRNFWTFTFQHSASYDLPVIFELVRRLNIARKVNVVALGEGALLLLAGLSDDPESQISDSIQHIFLLAPIINLGASEASFFKEFGNPQVRRLLTVSKTWDILTPEWARLPSISLTCSLHPNLCSSPWRLLNSKDPLINVVPSRLALYEKVYPAGSSLLNVMHWLQLQETKNLTKFDFGGSTNELIYAGLERPPIINLHKYKGRIFVVAAKEDEIAPPAIALKFARSFSSYSYLEIEGCHLSFLTGEDTEYLQDIADIINGKVFSFPKGLSNGNDKEHSS
eukprot:TRINITY_DN2322_c0_g1_i1.p1 TRINITY_DN2322_c0_g1~~TRINITY_DN2322_c0_g1_i1.p1  ORF type:complete len:439 (-),score=71.32 TRINITY_DN2322_c0_g1_i1:160-1476(-)